MSPDGLSHTRRQVADVVTNTTETSHINSHTIRAEGHGLKAVKNEINDDDEDEDNGDDNDTSEEEIEREEVSDQIKRNLKVVEPTRKLADQITFAEDDKLEYDMTKIFGSGKFAKVKITKKDIDEKAVQEPSQLISAAESSEAGDGKDDKKNNSLLLGGACSMIMLIAFSFFN